MITSLKKLWTDCWWHWWRKDTYSFLPDKKRLECVKCGKVEYRDV